ncbi:MAG: hypothetical protein RL329_3924 [Bacteroidota bacterium]|jgi:hypothetical protein
MFSRKNPWGLTPKEQFIEIIGNVMIGGLLIGCYLKVLFL